MKTTETARDKSEQPSSGGGLNLPDNLACSLQSIPTVPHSPILSIKGASPRTSSPVPSIKAVSSPSTSSFGPSLRAGSSPQSSSPGPSLLSSRSPACSSPGPSISQRPDPPSPQSPCHSDSSGSGITEGCDTPVSTDDEDSVISDSLFIIKVSHIVKAYNLVKS